MPGAATGWPQAEPVSGGAGGAGTWYPAGQPHGGGKVEPGDCGTPGDCGHDPHASGGRAVPVLCRLLRCRERLRFLRRSASEELDPESLDAFLSFFRFFL